MGSRYLTAAETAKLVRAALKAEFPGTKFSVTTRGSRTSLDVRYTDGPPSEKVRTVTRRYEGATFDGMIDLETTHSSLLTTADGGFEQVSFGAKYILVQRDYSTEVELAVMAEIQAYTGEVYEPNTRYPVAAFKFDGGGSALAMDTHRGDYGSSLLIGLIQHRDYSTKCECPGDSHYGMGGGKYRCAACGTPARETAGV